MKKPNAYSEDERLAALAAFLPAFLSDGFEFGEWYEPSQHGSPPWSMPYFLLSDGGSAFYKAAYEYGWVRPDFDWGAWHSTDEALRFIDNASAIENATSEQLAKLIRLYIRADRFCEGTLFGAFKSGHVVAIMRRAKALCDREQCTENEL